MNKAKFFGFIGVVAVCLMAVLPVLGAEPACVFTGVERVVAVGDVHGDYDRFVEVLRMAGLIGDDNHWTGGKSHLVQNGDILDRAPDSKKVMDLLMALEPEALAAGGMVHALIGNHEVMDMLGDLRYVHPGEIASYGGEAQFKAAMRPDGKYGKWIASHNCTIKIDDTLFLHGGLSPKYVNQSLEEMNRNVRTELQAGDPEKAVACNDSDGPIWFRGLALDEEAPQTEHVQAVKQRFGVNRIVVGHTVSKNGIQARFNGSVIMIDVGLSRVYGGAPACLLIEKGHCKVIDQAGIHPIDLTH